MSHLKQALTHCLIKLLAYWWFFSQKVTTICSKLSLPSRRKKHHIIFNYKTIKRAQKKQVDRFTVQQSWWRQARRAWRSWWHHLWRKQTKIKHANQKKIALYQKRQQQFVLKKKRTRFTQWLWLVIMSVFTFTLLGGSWWTWKNILQTLPNISDLTASQQKMTTKILDRNNHLLFEIYDDENRRPIALSEVAPSMVQATIAIEDRNFYQHPGFDFKAIIRAMRANSENGSFSQGASTITQQLVKLRLLTREKTLTRKLKEIILSVLVEGNFTKDQILEMYLNEVNYGGPVYGVEQAAVTFFGKNASNLTLSESAFLAGLPQAPSRYSPFTNDPASAYARRAEVLRRMREDGYITTEEEAQANNEELVFNSSQIKIQAPHFVMYVRQLLAEMYGEDMVNTGGLTVKTTLDLELQNQVQTIVTNEVDALARLKVSNGAALVMKPKTGEILAMVGSKDYFDFENDGQVNVTVRQRQPGSSIKPVTYATALEAGIYHPASLIVDAPITYHFKGGPDYTPKNYDGSYHGQVTVRQSLANSYNIPAVKTLAEVGIDKMIDQAEAMGITTWTDRGRLGLSLTLGGGEVTMLDMAQVYSTFANGGLTIEEDPFLEILDYKGKVLYHNQCALDNKCKATRTLSDATSYQISSILSDNDARAAAFGTNSVLYIPGQEVAVKTGTTNSLRDNWTIGYTSDVVVATWVGNNNNQPMSYVASGITGASPIWQKIILTQLDENNPHHFVMPSSIQAASFCGKTEYFRANQPLPLQACKAPLKKPDDQVAQP